MINDGKKESLMEIHEEALHEMIEKQRKNGKTWTGFFNLHHPSIILESVNIIEGGLILNSTLRFDWCGNSQNTLNIDLPSL